MLWITAAGILVTAFCGWAGIMLLASGIRLPVEKQTLGKKFRINFSEDRSFYNGAKEKYSAGARVVLYYDMIATDTVYDFYLDGQRLNYDYDDQKGFILTFIMPPHDVVLELRQKNISVCE